MLPCVFLVVPADVCKSLYYKADGMWYPFRCSVVRLSILVDILNALLPLGGAGLKSETIKLDVGLFHRHCERLTTLNFGVHVQISK